MENVLMEENNSMVDRVIISVQRFLYLAYPAFTNLCVSQFFAISHILHIYALNKMP